MNLLVIVKVHLLVDNDVFWWGLEFGGRKSVCF